MRLLCPYCQQTTKLVNGLKIYPHRSDLGHKKFYLCEPCDAYVGCHDGTNVPLGTPANAELRSARKRAHAVFDPIWKEGHLTRGAAYKWLTSKLCATGQIHIGQSDLPTCLLIENVCKEKLNELHCN